MRVLISGGSPVPVSAGLAASVAASCDAVVAVDRGLDVLMEAGVSPDLFCGDADSVCEEGAELVRAAERAPAGADRPFEVERYNPAKDYTDLSLALRAAGERWPGATIACIGLSSGRPDHYLGCLGCLVSWEGPVELFEDDYEGRILHGGSGWEILGRPGARFSFVPLSEEAEVSIRGMRWTLDHRRGELLSDLGISNVITADAADIECHEGVVGAWVFK